MARSVYSRPWRTLGVLLALSAILYGLIAAGTIWDKKNAQWTPKLALDLEGGFEFVLDAKPRPGSNVKFDQTSLEEAVKIIRQRVDGSGVAEALITTQGDKSIVVQLPGKTIDENTKKAIQAPSAMEFRPVLAVQDPPLPEPVPTGSGSPSPSASGSASPAASGGASVPALAPSGASASPAAPKATTTATSTSNGMPLPKALLAASGTPSPTTSGSPATAPTGAASPASPAASGSAAKPGAASASPQPSPTDPSDVNWIDPAVTATFSSIDCTTPAGRAKAQQQVNDPKKPFVACEDTGQKYILGPVEIEGRHITDASASLQTTSQGTTTTNWQVNLSFDGEGADQFAKTTSRLFSYGVGETRNRFAIVLDNAVISAPTTQAAIVGGNAQITGNFNQVSSQALANQLKFGALPIAFEPQQEREISATLGAESLQRGLLAGVIGLLLVVVYSLFQYRALGMVTVASLTIAGVLTYGFLVLLGWRQGLRLSLAGVAGVIVSIGITADSFIVYFERIRDEVRDGRPLQAAVEIAWQRARRTILASDAVSFLAAVVLYLLAVGSVRGFAFTLGLTTVVDIAVVFLFTKPTVVLLSRTHFFGGGHKLSGFDADHLGRSVTYAGRGRVRPPSAKSSGRGASAGAAASTGAGLTIAERRAAAERAAKSSTAVLEGELADETDVAPDEPSPSWAQRGSTSSTADSTSGRDA